jgi:uncharacterized integral membrane protein
MVQSTLRLIFTLAAVALMITLALANRHLVDMKFDPFNPETPALALRLPLYAYLFAMLILGSIIGGMASWFAQGKWRRQARHRTQEALRWKAETDRLIRERDASVTARKQLTRA